MRFRSRSKYIGRRRGRGKLRATIQKKKNIDDDTHDDLIHGEVIPYSNFIIII